MVSKPIVIVFMIVFRVNLFMERKNILNFTQLIYKEKILEWLLDERIFYYSRVSKDERVRATTYKLRYYFVN